MYQTKKDISNLAWPAQTGSSMSKTLKVGHAIFHRGNENILAENVRI